MRLEQSGKWKANKEAIKGTMKGIKHRALHPGVIYTPRQN